MNREPVAASLHADKAAFDQGPPGSIFLWRFDAKQQQLGNIMLKCPGCGSASSIHVHVPGAADDVAGDIESWEISGLPDKLTLTPSLDAQGCCGWHGHLTEGIFKL